MSRILILGATSDVATEMAKELVGGDNQLYLVARSAEKLADLTALLGTSVVGSSCYDFMETQEAETHIRQAIETLGTLDLALIAHGYLGDQLLSERELGEATQTVRINFESVVAQLIPLGNYFEAQRSGQLAVISSVAGERGRPRNYTYGASKQALTIYLQGLRSRLYPHTVVTTVKLGPVDTRMTTSHAKNASFVSKEAAARKILHAIRTRQGEVYVPGYWRAIMAVVTRLPEAIFQRLNFLSAR